jgi:hypothetical protein
MYAIVSTGIDHETGLESGTITLVKSPVNAVESTAPIVKIPSGKESSK